jgi:hypothetical protein
MITERAVYDVPEPYMCTVCQGEAFPKLHALVENGNVAEEQYACSACAGQLLSAPSQPLPKLRLKKAWSVIEDWFTRTKTKKETVH